MKRNLIAGALLLALAGLVFIQFRLLVIGVRLEKQGFDQKAHAALQAVGDSLNQAGLLSDALIARLQMPDAPKSTALFLADTLDGMLVRELNRRGITARFTFALTDQFGGQTFLASQHFNIEKFTFDRYKVPLGDRIIGRCHCMRVIHLDMDNLFRYLLRDLDYLVIPSLLCLLVILGCLALLINILRKEEKLNLIKNDFINNLTHELNTPAFSISLSAKMARDNLEKGDTAKAQHLLQIIEKENEKLKTHIDKVLELASLESPRHHLQKKEVHLHDLISDLLADVDPQVKKLSGRLIFSPEATHDLVAVDAVHFKNVLRNLLDNSLKYTKGQPEIQVITASGSHFFEITVRDNGIGIAPEHRRLIFQKFYRVPSGDHGNVKGFGLGLSYVRQVMKAHGGQVNIESQPGKGTAVSLKFTF